MLLLSLRKEQSISFAGSLQYTDPKRIFFALLVFRMVQKNGPARVKRRMQWEAPSKPLAVDDPLLLPERKVHAEIGINWHKLVFRPRDTERRVCHNPSRVATLRRTPW